MSTQNLHNDPGRDESSHFHRIGTVSRLANVPVSTLRMWESRHAAFTPVKTEGLHRLYTDADVVRARLLRQLSEAGHGVARIAQLPLEQLQQMLTQARAASGARASEPPTRLDVVVVGAALATRLQSAQWRSRLDGALLHVRAVFMDVDELQSDEATAALRDAPVLIARLNALQPVTAHRLAGLRSALGLRHAVVLYNFGPQAAVDALRAAGFLLRREPVDDADIGELLRSVTWASDGRAETQESRPAAIPGRRFSEAELATIAASPSDMLCECPRHLADIVAQLVSFEEYSRQCLNDSEEDAHVHAQLRSVAGSARALFEHALEMVIEHDRRRGRNTARTGR